ncbi:ClpP/crotonase-like domain-containing protein [Aspergillus pseudodeflectus]|uniref:ClpP/crotonase-like domain-containing protein n=1 Tax=Aspergillus pseudodeflectus TaxID=176178 RepID=A0ABR4JSP2_9EURO
MASPTMIQLEGPENGILWIKLNRPASGNSLHPTLVHELLHALLTADRDPAVRIIILTGNGRFFCTGMDLLSADELSFAPGDDFHQLNRVLITTEKILIAAVNGPASGFGATCLALCDLVFAVPDVYFFTPFVKWGMVPEAASSVSFLRLMGHQRAALLCLTGERIGAEEARDLGLVSKVLPAEGFLGKVGEVADKLARAPAGSLLQTKRLLKETTMKDLLDANDRECRVIVEERIPSGDLHKGREAFQAAQREKERRKSAL